MQQANEVVQCCRVRASLQDPITDTVYYLLWEPQANKELPRLRENTQKSTCGEASCVQVAASKRKKGDGNRNKGSDADSDLQGRETLQLRLHIWLGYHLPLSVQQAVEDVRQGASVRPREWVPLAA